MLPDIWQSLITYTATDPGKTVNAILNNSLIGIYHFSILAIAIKIARDRPDFKFNLKIWSFFIINGLCGISRFWGVYNIYIGNEALTAVIRLVFSILSVGSIIVLWFILPDFIKLPSMKKLEEINNELESKVTQLDDALQTLTETSQEKDRAVGALVQAQKMEAVGQLTGGIAHDFNNLLLAISGNLELIRMNPRSDRVDRWVGTGLDALARAAHLTAQLLTFSRVQKLQLKEVSLLPLLTNVKDLIARTLGPEIKITLTHLADVTINVDPVQLELAILNLSLNARDAMGDAGSLTISSTVDNGFVDIDVTDTGTGIPIEIANRVFEPFFTTKDIGKGTGLGLSMVYGVANQFGGDVHIKATSSKGTTITISLPVIEVVNPVFTVEMPNIPNLCSSKTILLIDDDQSVRETLSEMLTLQGHKVTSVEDGVEGLNHLKHNRPDLVLVDYAMPVMNGAAVSKAAKLIYPDLVIVFVTGFSESKALRGQTILKKPFKMEDIERLLQSIF